MKTYMWSSMSAMLALAMALKVTSSPTYLVGRDNSDSNTTTIAVSSSVDKYSLDDGSIDLASLIEDSAVTLIEVPATATTPTFLTFPTAALLASAAADADVAFTTTVAADSAAATPNVARRAVAPGTTGVGGTLAAWDASFCKDTTPGAGPVLTPDTTENFSNNNWANQRFGQSAAAAAPSGYTKAFGPYYKAIQATTATASLGIDGSYRSYDPAACAQECNKRSNCQAIVFWMSRDTDIDYYSSANRAANYWQRCNNPPTSRTNYVCGLYSARVTKEMATNEGQMKGPIFKTAHAALNAYFKSDPVVPIEGYSTQVNQAGIIDNSYTHQFLLDIITPNSNPEASGYVPEFCGASCSTRSDCAGFDSASMYKDGQFVGTLCNLYGRSFDVSEQPAKGGQYTRSGYVSTQPAVFYTKESFVQAT
ncbi:hypothetical protein NDA16_002591 [Ustilago loliicola]|nr:hypothetical protein NDA16_002591 [Ustilago loliicola]